MTRHFLRDDDITAAEQARLLDDAVALKAARRTPGAGRPLAGRSVALVFEKPSTRTRLSFEVGVHELGGLPVVLDAQTSQLGRGETIGDTARLLSRYVDAVTLRTFSHARVEELAAASSVPVVNALTDLLHPCQALADLLTLRERRGRLSGLTLGYLGDGNNVAHSLLLAGALAGLHVRVASPAGFAPDTGIVARAAELASASGGSVLVTQDPGEAAAGADALYTDVWASMGQEDEAAGRARVFRPYQLDAAAVTAAADDVLVLHCLPAHRGEEIAAEVMDGPHSVVWQQAENRLHAQKALLAFLLADDAGDRR